MKCGWLEKRFSVSKSNQIESKLRTLALCVSSCVRFESYANRNFVNTWYTNRTESKLSSLNWMGISVCVVCVFDWNTECLRVFKTHLRSQRTQIGTKSGSQSVSVSHVNVRMHGDYNAPEHPHAHTKSGLLNRINQCWWLEFFRHNKKDVAAFKSAAKWKQANTRKKRGRKSAAVATATASAFRHMSRRQNLCRCVRVCVM